MLCILSLVGFTVSILQCLVRQHETLGVCLKFNSTSWTSSSSPTRSKQLMQSRTWSGVEHVQGLGTDHGFLFFYLGGCEWFRGRGWSQSNILKMACCTYSFGFKSSPECSSAGHAFCAHLWLCHSHSFYLPCSVTQCRNESEVDNGSKRKQGLIGLYLLCFFSHIDEYNHCGWREGGSWGPMLCPFWVWKVMHWADNFWNSLFKILPVCGSTSSNSFVPLTWKFGSQLYCCF